MADVTQQSSQENIAAYKAGVESKAAARGWVYTKGDRPDGQSDIDYAAVEKKPNDEILEVRLPVGDMSLKQMFAQMANIPEASIAREIPGTAARMYREIGQHEAGHTHRAGSMGGEGLHEEIAGDRTAYNNDDPEMEEVIRDTRKLASLTNITHATSPALPKEPGGEAPETVTAKLFNAAKTFRETVAADLLSNGHIEKVEDIKALQEKNPEVIRKSVETLQKSGAFDEMDGSRGEYVRQYAQEYLDASKKWLAAPETSAPTQSAPKASAPAMAP